LDWYSILVGVFASATLALHGANYLAWKTDGPVSERSRALGKKLSPVLAVAWVLVTWATVAVHPAMFHAFAHRPLAWLCLAITLAGVAAVLLGVRRGRTFLAFLGSSGFIAGLLGATASSLFPVLLRAIPDAALSMTAYDASSDAAGLRTALGWWSIGFPIAIIYIVVLFRLHRGKAQAAAEGEGY